jgi:hypothetical protein
MNHALAAAALVLADDAPGNTGPDFGKASPFGLLVIVLLLIGTFLLVRSMNRQLKKVPDSFDRDHPAPDQAADAGTVEPAGDDGDDGDDKPQDGAPPEESR